MEAKAKIFGHAIHPILVVFPLGLLGTSLVFDLIGKATDTGEWLLVAYYMIGAGVLGGLLAAVFGLIDWLAIPRGTRASAVGLVHGLGMVGAVAFFAGSWLLRRGNPVAPEDLAIGLSAVGFLIALASGWLGGELVQRMGVGVSPGANLDAPMSLGREAHLGAQRHGK
jgi:uncharacterized membrane protein